jgi:tripartite-type tricarboxylate transporter receptor subunit TctC
VSLPNVPTVGQTVKGYEVTGLLGIGAPKSTPADVVDKLNKEINAVLVDPSVKEKLAGVDSIVRAGTPADFGNLIREEADKWAKVVRFAGLRPR